MGTRDRKVLVSLIGKEFIDVQETVLNVIYGYQERKYT